MDNFAASFDAECPIHMGTMENPRLLPCAHEFCYTCLVFIHARNKGKVVCPICKYSIKVTNVTQLPLGSSPVSMVADKKPILPEEIAQVLIALQNVEKSCDETVERLEEMTAEILGIKASSEHKRQALEDIALERDNKRGISATETCNFVQKSTQMLHNELFLQLNSHLPKFINAIEVYKGMEIPVFRTHPDLGSPEKTDEIFKFASSLFLQLPTGEYGLLANSLAKYLQGTLADDDSRIWTVLAGEKAGFWTSHDDYLSLDLGGIMIVACPCTSINPIPTVKEEMEKFLLQKCTESLMQWKNDQCPNPTVFVQKQLETETRLHWHCAAGDKSKLSLESGKTLGSLYSISIGDLCFFVWQS